MRIFFLFLFFNSTSCFAQNIEFDYLPQNKDSLEKYVNEVNNKKIKKFGDNYHKKIKENIQERKAVFLNKISDSSFVFNKRITAYLNTILKEIYFSNPEINKNDFYFFIDKSQLPNAACYGNGIFTVNLGLFKYVNSDDELAYILCHEIAHYVLEHNDKSLLNYFETINSKENKKKIKVLKNQKYGKRKAYSELIEDLSYNFLMRSQEVEIEADSLGLLLFKNTKFNINASITSLKNLELSDKLLFNEDPKLKENFNFQNYPFKDVWIKKDETLFDITKSSDDFILDKDSLSSHPSIPLRIEKLNFLINNRTSSIVENTNELNEIKKLVSFVSIINFIDSNKLDMAFYQCLVMHNQKLIDSKMYAEIMSKLLRRTYELKEKHTFGRYVSPIYPFSDELYLNDVKQFLHNLELKNIRKIGLNFCLSYKEIMKQNKEFKETLNYFSSLNH
ncbi:hypothetical protein EQG68_01450 [Flavobacterium piscinae]|uniref:Peptidase M48 domain-containing protein n=1 Tax=Flavobacterium piscinae TaxID=2506424 RepID=A0A4Q1KYX1_9FLAO|nr:M48 family metallopeptidase [Flavobacterium piscinae]RXR35591.1 hypothetical protein EQG68_01450 [Flavobacterium piscinae]